MTSADSAREVCGFNKFRCIVVAVPFVFPIIELLHGRGLIETSFRGCCGVVWVSGVLLKHQKSLKRLVDVAFENIL